MLLSFLFKIIDQNICLVKVDKNLLHPVYICFQTRIALAISNFGALSPF